MKRSSFVLLIFFAVISLALPSYAKKPGKEQKPPIISVNRGHEWLKAIGHGASTITLIVAAIQMFLTAKRVQIATQTVMQRAESADIKLYSPLIYAASMIGFVTLLKLAYSDSCKCLEALKKASTGYANLS